MREVGTKLGVFTGWEMWNLDLSQASSVWPTELWRDAFNESPTDTGLSQMETETQHNAEKDAQDLLEMVSEKIRANLNQI